MIAYLLSVSLRAEDNQFSESWQWLPASSETSLCDALWYEGEPKSEAATLCLLDMTGGTITLCLLGKTGEVALPDAVVKIGRGVAESGVWSIVDEELVTLAASLDVGILFSIVVEGKNLAGGEAARRL